MLKKMKWQNDEFIFIFDTDAYTERLNNVIVVFFCFILSPSWCTREKRKGQLEVLRILISILSFHHKISFPPPRLTRAHTHTQHRFT